MTHSDYEDFADDLPDANDLPGSDGFSEGVPELADEEQSYKDSPLTQPSSAWSICTLLAHRSCFQRFGNFFDGSRYLENMTWFLRASRQGAVIEVLPEVLMYRRFNIDSLTRRGRSQYLAGFFPIIKEWRDFQRERSEK